MLEVILNPYLLIFIVLAQFVIFLLCSSSVPISVGSSLQGMLSNVYIIHLSYFFPAFCVVVPCDVVPLICFFLIMVAGFEDYGLKILCPYISCFFCKSFMCGLTLISETKYFFSMPFPIIYLVRISQSVGYPSCL